MEAPGEKLLMRLWDTMIDKGISGLLDPWQTRRKNRAKIDGMRQEELALAQAQRDAGDIRAGRKMLDSQGQLIDVLPQGSSLPGSIDSDQTVVAIAERNRITREIRADVNTSKALLIAEDVLRDDPQAPPERMVDDDWIFRWRDAASMVSSQELQELWGRALAGEIKSPGSCSLRTLEFLRNLSHGEALQIANLAPFVVDDDLIVREPDTEEVLESEGITSGILLDLQTLGIVKGIEGIEDFGWSKEFSLASLDSRGTCARALRAYDRVLAITHDDPTKTFKLRGCFLTPTGAQVLKLGSFKPHEVYIRSVGKAIVGKGFSVSIGRFEQVDSRNVRLIEPEEITL